MWVQSLVQEDPLEEDMTTHSRILAWRTPRTEKPDKLQSWQSMHPEGCTELDTTEVT